MQTIKAEREKNNAQSSRFVRRIGSTLYDVNVYVPVRVFFEQLALVLDAHAVPGRLLIVF